MGKTREKMTRKRALLIVLAVFVLILTLIFTRGASSKKAEPDLSTTQGRARFLSELGWEINTATETYRSVTVPTELTGIMKQYNRMQQTQGYDLSEHLGEKCEQYTYVLTNYSDAEGTVLVTMYIRDGKIIAGDIHTTAANGFMHALRRNDAKGK